MSECINCGKKGCNPKVNSECVIYNGNYITGVNISKGDNFTTVVNKLAAGSGSVAENTSAVNLSGPGVGIFTSKVGGNIQLRRINAGAGVQVTENGNNVLITNMSPDQVVTLSAGNNIRITGVYPNFTIESLAETSLNESFTLTANGSKTVGTGETIYEIHLKATNSLFLNIGMTPGGSEILDAWELYPNQTEIIDFKKTADVSFNLYFSSSSWTGASLSVKLVKKII